MNVRKENRDLLIKYFENGSKRNCIEKLGVELEHLIVKAETKESVTYQEEKGIEYILEQMSVHFPWRYEPEGHLIGIYNEDYSISLEPAGQLEISINPRENISLIYRIYRMFLEQIHPILRECGYEMLTLGYLPRSKVRDMPLIPKKRYEFMDRYFMETGTCGINMMRGTAATQVSIDYCSEQDFVQKIRAAYMLMPLLKLLTDNTPIMEGESCEGYMARSYIWDNVDPARTGIPKGLFDDDFGFAKYADFLLDMPPVFVENQDTPMYTGHKSTAEVWGDERLTRPDIEHILSMNFQDVRLKHYLEIRYADSMPIKCVLAYAALLKGIFYNEELMREINEKFSASEAEIRKAQESLMKHGFDGKAYGYEAAKLLSYVIGAAKNQLVEAEQLSLLPLEEILYHKRTLAREYYENNIR